MKRYCFGLMISFVLSIDLYGLGWLNFESFDKCLQRHEKAFKDFEPEASEVKVDKEVKVKGQLHWEFTTIYSPITPHLKEYLDAAIKLSNKLRTKATFKGLILGTILGAIHAGLLTETTPQFKKINGFFNLKTRLASIFSLPLIGSIGLILLENKSKAPQPYFDRWSMKKIDNIFGTLETLERVLYALPASIGAEFVSLIGTSLLLSKIK